MNKRKIVKVLIQGIFCGILCFVMTGCRVPDKALVFSMEEQAVVSEACEEEVEQGLENRIYVYVCGAVAEPGVVELPEGSRAADALLAGGGFTADAKEDYVNLAAKVEDGQKLYFPTEAEVQIWETEKRQTEKGIVNINTADKEQLMTLPGIGETRAEDIIAYRNAHGAFQKKEDLKKVSGIKENMYEKLAEKIVVE